MAEWSKAQHWKCCVGVSLPWVQIPLSPPFFVPELSLLNSVSGFTMSSDMVPYRMIRQIPLSPPFFCSKNGEGRRKASLHCAVRHNFTQKTKFFLHIFTKLRKPCLLVHRSLVRRWMKSLHFIPLVKTFASLTCEVAACRRVEVFLFTALRLNGGKPP